ncbi:VP3 [Letea virus]|nr:VP3 [Letea virus]QIQ51185.1 VP3 [Letea virus]QIQ51205.1 VP3 [Letea virus]QIQ51255.1 VP3 [Letea virus]
MTDNQVPTAPLEKTSVPRKQPPYLVGSSVHNDSGPLLSVFALQEIMEKVRSAQQEMAGAALDVDAAPVDVIGIISEIKKLIDVKPYEIVNKIPTSYRHIVMQSEEIFLQISTYYEMMSEAAEDVNEFQPEAFYKMILKKIRKLRQEGAKVFYAIGTHDYRGMEIVNADMLGVDLTNVLPMLNTYDRQMVQIVLDRFLVTNALLANRRVDLFDVAMAEPLYRIYTRLQGYIEAGQEREFRLALEWLTKYGEAKRVEFSNQYITDFRRGDTIYLLTINMPPNPYVIWSVPRCGITNLIFNIALSLPMGEYILPNPRIASITLSQRITQTNPFSTIVGMTPTAQQMDDVRKIYLALLFPGQIVLDLKLEQAHNIEPSIRMVGGVVGHLLFTYGRNFSNITRSMARALDRALADFLLHMTPERVPVVRGVTEHPLDFRIGRRNMFDCLQLAADHRSGAGYNGHAVDDVRRAADSPYEHLYRRIAYCGLDHREVIDERIFGEGMRYNNYDMMIEALAAAGKDQEVAYLRRMQPYHITRFAYINQIINEDLLSAFSMPDDEFNRLLPDLVDGNYVPGDTIVLDVGWPSLWFAFTRRFLPTERSEALVIQPLVESLYASELSVMKLDLQNLSLLRTRFPDNLARGKPTQFWRAALEVAPEPIKKLMNLTQSFDFVNVADVIRWARDDQIQESMAYVLESEAWNVAADTEELMLIEKVYMRRTMLPEPRLEDIDDFRRKGFYHTNALDGLPPDQQVVMYTHNLALHQANLGQLKSEIRRMLDMGKFIEFGQMLRSLKLKIFDARPGDDVLCDIPFKYIQAEQTGMNYATIEYATQVLLYYLVYKVEYSNTPDSLITINPTYSMINIYFGKRLVKRVGVPQLLSEVKRRITAYKYKIRLMDLTSMLVAGNQLATLHI